MFLALTYLILVRDDKTDEDEDNDKENEVRIGFLSYRTHLP